MATRRVRKDEFEIRYPNQLAQLLRVVVQGEFGGDVVNCAKAMRLSHRSQLWRLLKAKRRLMRRDTYLALWQLPLIPEAQLALSLYVATPRIRLLEDGYSRWTVELTNALAGNAFPAFDPGAFRWYPAGSQLAVLLRSEKASGIDRVIDKINVIWKRRGGLELAQGVFVADEWRWWLTVFRLVGPLLQSAASGGIERSVDELSDDELDEYLEGAIQAELVLLRRPSIAVRALLVEVGSFRDEASRTRKIGLPRPFSVGSIATHLARQAREAPRRVQSRAAEEAEHKKTLDECKALLDQHATRGDKRRPRPRRTPPRN